MPTCHHCGQPIKVGQAELTKAEKARVNWAGPPENGRPNIIEAKYVKAIALYYGVDNWIEHWDKSASPSENEEIFRRMSAHPGTAGPTMREIDARESIRTGDHE